MPNPTINLASGQPAFSEPTPVRGFEPDFPYPQNPFAIIYKTRFMQFRAYYAKPAVNAAHPNLPQVYFVDDVDFQDRPNGLIQFTRVWATIPTEWNDFESHPYGYPGWGFGLAVAVRNPVTYTVTAKLTLDYFAVGTLPTFSDLLANYDDFNNASWTKSGATTTPNAATVPNCAGGALVAAKVVESNTAAEHKVYQASNAAAGNVAGTVFLQRGDRTSAKVAIGKNDASLTFGDLLVDLNTGFVTANAASNYAVAAIGDAWWRVDIVANAANANAALIVLLANGSNSTNYTGDGASGLYAWRGQLVAGSAIPHATVPPTLTPDGTNYPIQTADFVPVKFGQRYFYNSNIFSNVVVEYLSNASTPNYATYNAFIVTDSGNINSYSIEANDSIQSLWMGGIWQRQRRFVKAR